MSTLRLLLSEIRSAEKEKKAPLEEAEIIQIIKRQIKRRKEAIEQYAKAGRGDLADKEEREKEILEAYMPEQMSEEEIRKAVKTAISELQASSMADMGKVMGKVMADLAGKADGSVVNKIVKEELGNN